MTRSNWQFYFGASLVALSAILYSIHYAIFKDAHHIFIFLVEDIAFIPIEVLIVTLIIHQLLDLREKRLMLKKLNMVIGAFYSEVGTELLKKLAGFDLQFDKIKASMLVMAEWSDKEFSDAIRAVKNDDYKIDSKQGDLGALRSFLLGKRAFLLRLLENPNLLEHESFTELLWAVFHLTEELASRGNTENLPEADYRHLSGDLRRAYVLLVREWLKYMQHLSKDYPYLFSFAVRINPFNPDASPEVKQ